MATTGEKQDDPLQPYATEERVALYDKNVTDEDCNVYCMNNVMWGQLTPEKVAGASVLVLPCGTGRNVRRLAKLGAARIMACDVAPKNLEFCQAHDAEQAAAGAATDATAAPGGASSTVAADEGATDTETSYVILDAKLPRRVYADDQPGADISVVNDAPPYSSLPPAVSHSLTCWVLPTVVLLVVGYVLLSCVAGDSPLLLRGESSRAPGHVSLRSLEHTAWWDCDLLLLRGLGCVYHSPVQ